MNQTHGERVRVQMSNDVTEEQEKQLDHPSVAERPCGTSAPINDTFTLTHLHTETCMSKHTDPCRRTCAETQTTLTFNQTVVNVTKSQGFTKQSAVVLSIACPHIQHQ